MRVIERASERAIKSKHEKDKGAESKRASKQARDGQRERVSVRVRNKRESERECE